MREKTCKFWFERAIAWADSLTSNPEEWHSIITNIQLDVQRSAYDADAIRQLIQYFLHFVLESHKASNIILKAYDALIKIDSRPPQPLYMDLEEGIHCALVEMGIRATPYLMAAYNAVSSAAPEKRWILVVLSDIGDPSSRSLFDNINIDDMFNIIKSEYEIEMDGIEDNDQNEDMINRDLLMKAQDSIDALRLRYDLALKK